MSLIRRWTEFRARRRMRRENRRALRVERKLKPHEYGADKTWGEAWKGGGSGGGGPIGGP